MKPQNKILCMIVDDEPLAINVLKKHVEVVPYLQLASTCNNAVEALANLQDHHIDLLFLDIQMPHILGTDFVRSLKNPPKIIFTTAYRKFAIEGFELNAVDYLLKPISFERFLKAVNKVMNITERTSSESNPPDLLEEGKDAEKSFLYFKADRKMVKVLLDEILYVESLKDYIKIITKSNTIITKHSMSSLEGILPKEKFIRIHRSYMIALNKVDSFTHNLVVINKKQLPISRMYRLDLSKRL